MADAKETMKEERPALKIFERNRPFYGQLMSVRTKELEYSYFNEKRYLLNRLIHGIGLVRGLEVSNVQLVGGKILKINLTAGAALDCWGMEIVVDQDQIPYHVTDQFDSQKPYLYIRRKYCVKDPEPALISGSACGESCCYSRIKEDFEIIQGGAPEPCEMPEAPSGGDATTEDICQKHLGKDPRCTCDEPRVLIAVLKADGTLNEAETRKQRAIVYNNPMLSDLIRTHTADVDNPHETTAEQVGALRSVNGQKGDANQNVDIKSGGAITIGSANNEITIGENHSTDKNNPHDVMLGITTNGTEVKHKGGYVKLTASDNSIKIEPKPGENEIRISCESGGEDLYKMEAPLTLRPGTHGYVVHKFPRPPVVDVYRKVSLTHLFFWEDSEDLKQTAELSGVDRRLLLRAPTLRQFAQEHNISIPDPRARNVVTFEAVLKKVPSPYHVLLSSKMQGQLATNILELLDKGRVFVQTDSWAKGLGSQASLDLRVLQYPKRVLLRNVNLKETYDLMVILRA